MKLTCETKFDGTMVLESKKEDLTIQEMTEGFKLMLRSMGYVEETIEETFQKSRGDNHDIPVQTKRFEFPFKIRFRK